MVAKAISIDKASKNIKYFEKLLNDEQNNIMKRVLTDYYQIIRIVRENVI